MRVFIASVVYDWDFFVPPYSDLLSTLCEKSEARDALAAKQKRFCHASLYGLPIVKIGINFECNTRTVSGWR